jgi:competence ComEA-like helix-hairpin-helix protein
MMGLQLPPSDTGHVGRSQTGSHPSGQGDPAMNKLTTLLQSIALSLLLVGGAHASTANKAASNKAAVVAGATTTHHRAPKHQKTGQKVNINTADADAIHQALIDIGPSKAAAIVAWRKQHGAFHSADQLTQVKGIGLKTIEKNRSYIVVGSVASAGPAKN